MTSGAAPYAENRYTLERRRASVGFVRIHAVEMMFALGFVCQVALLSGSIGQARILFRMAVFGTSVALLFALRGKGKPSPAVKPAKFIVAIIALAFFNPGSNTLAASRSTNRDVPRDTGSLVLGSSLHDRSSPISAA